MNNRNARLLFLFVNILLLINFIDSQFINIFNVTKPYELRISIIDKNGTFQHYVQSFNFMIDDHCSDLYYGETKNNDSHPVNSSANVLVYKGAEKKLNFILEISFSTPENQGFLEGYEIRIIENSKQFSCLRLLSSPLKSFPISMRFQLSIKDPKEFTKQNSKYAFFFGRISMSSLTYCDHNAKEYCRISKSLINLDAGIESDEESLKHTKMFQNDIIRESYRFNERQPKICIKLRKHIKIFFGFRFSLVIKLHDFYFTSKSMLTNQKYKLSLLHFTCKKSEITSDNKFCLGEPIEQKRIESFEQIVVEDLNEGLYAVELQPILNTTFCKAQCPYQINEKSTSLSCETCQKVISYFQILPAKAINMFTCMNDDDETLVDELKPKIKLETNHLAEQSFTAKYSLKSYKSLKSEINWLQIGLIVALSVLIVGILIVVGMVLFKMKKKSKRIQRTKAESAALNNNEAED